MTHNADKDAGCQCEHPYLGAQLAGTPLRCEECRRLVLADGLERINVAHTESLRRLDEWAKANPMYVTPPEAGESA